MNRSGAIALLIAALAAIFAFLSIPYVDRTWIQHKSSGGAASDEEASTSPETSSEHPHAKPPLEGIDDARESVRAIPEAPPPPNESSRLLNNSLARSRAAQDEAAMAAAAAIEVRRLATAAREKAESAESRASGSSQVGYASLSGLTVSNVPYAYLGQVANGKAAGYGVQRAARRTISGGPWVDDDLNGYFYVTNHIWTICSRYVGLEPIGYMYTYNNETRIGYLGEVKPKRNQSEIAGVWYLPNGDELAGRFDYEQMAFAANSTKTGFGRLTAKDGLSVEGYFVNGQIDGYGRAVWKNGKVLEGRLRSINGTITKID